MHLSIYRTGGIRTNQTTSARQGRRIGGLNPGLPDQFLEAVSKLSFGLPPFFGGIGASFKILEIPMYACGFKLGPAARVPAKPLGEDGTLNQNPNFETASNHARTMMLMLSSISRLNHYSHYNKIVLWQQGKEDLF